MVRNVFNMSPWLGRLGYRTLHHQRYLDAKHSYYCYDFYQPSTQASLSAHCL